MTLDPLLIALAGKTEISLLPALANRHGCITGATGTGKTVTLQRLAEQFSRAGVPIFLADVKGDLSGLGATGSLSPKLKERLDALGMPAPDFAPCPVTFWDVLGEQGHPVRATVSDLGPLLLARLFNLNETQEGVLSLAFKVADDQGLLLLDLKDLRALLRFVAENQAAFKTQYGNVSAASVGAIQRALTQIEQQGGERFFGEPMLDVQDLLQTDGNGHGLINILAADQLLQTPRVYACFLLWLLAELFEQLPEAGDLETERAFIAPPGSRIGPLAAEERAALIQGSVVANVYEQTVDRESAFEKLRSRAQGGGVATPQTTPNATPSAPTPAAGGGAWGGLNELLFGRTGPRGGHHPGMVDALAKSAARSVGSAVAREITRGIFGSLKRR